MLYAMDSSMSIVHFYSRWSYSIQRLPVKGKGWMSRTVETPTGF